MIVAVDRSNMPQAAAVHSISWQDSHRAFCSPDFISLHTPERQQAYLEKKMAGGSAFYLLMEKEPLGIVSVTGNLIEDLYVLPDHHNQGYGTALLQFAIEKCTGIPTLWILENNVHAARLYRRMGFQETGKRNVVSGGLDEIEFALASPT